MIILHGHISQETAYVVANYPYGFTLRCHKRWWLDDNQRGCRLVSQTSNPKIDNNVAPLTWNKPKVSTYASIAGCMYLDDNNRVQWADLHGYATLEKSLKFLTTYQEGIPEYSLVRLKYHIQASKA